MVCGFRCCGLFDDLFFFFDYILLFLVFFRIHRFLFFRFIRVDRFVRLLRFIFFGSIQLNGKVHLQVSECILIIVAQCLPVETYSQCNRSAFTLFQSVQVEPVVQSVCCFVETLASLADTLTADEIAGIQNDVLGITLVSFIGQDIAVGTACETGITLPSIFK